MSIIYLRFYFMYCAFYDSGQMCNDLIHHCTTAQSIFTAGSSLLCLFILSPLPSPMANMDFSDHLRCFAFSRML